MAEQKIQNALDTGAAYIHPPISAADALEGYITSTTSR
jgi:hypothetical protein